MSDSIGSPDLLDMDPIEESNQETASFHDAELSSLENTQESLDNTVPIETESTGPHRIPLNQYQAIRKRSLSSLSMESANTEELLPLSQSSQTPKKESAGSPAVKRKALPEEAGNQFTFLADHDLPPWLQKPSARDLELSQKSLGLWTAENIRQRRVKYILFSGCPVAIEDSFDPYLLIDAQLKRTKADCLFRVGPELLPTDFAKLQGIFVYMEALFQYLPALSYIERRAYRAQWITDMFKYVITFCLFIEIECKKRALFGWMGFVMQIRAMLIWRVVGIALPMESRVRTGENGQEVTVGVLPDASRVGCRLKNVDLDYKWIIEYEPSVSAAQESLCSTDDFLDMMGEFTEPVLPRIPYSPSGSFYKVIETLKYGDKENAGNSMETEQPSTATLLSEILIAQQLFREGRHWMINGFRPCTPSAIWGFELAHLNLKSVIQLLRRTSMSMDEKLGKLGLASRKHYPRRVSVDFSEFKNAQYRLDFLMDWRTVEKIGRSLLAEFRKKMGFDATTAI